MAIPDWHDDDTDDDAVRSPRRPSGTATRDRSASSLVSTLGKPAGLYGGSVLGFHERNAGTTAFSPFSPIARTAGGAPTPGPGRISLAGGGSPRVARLRLDDFGELAAPKASGRGAPSAEALDDELQALARGGLGASVRVESLERDLRGMSEREKLQHVDGPLPVGMPDEGH